MIHVYPLFPDKTCMHSLVCSVNTEHLYHMFSTNTSYIRQFVSKFPNFSGLLQDNSIPLLIKLASIVKVKSLSEISSLYLCQTSLPDSRPDNARYRLRILCMKDLWSVAGSGQHW